MTPKEQDELYQTMRATFPAWTFRFTSGYVHGRNDEPEQGQPDAVYVEADDDYALGYKTGFAVARGADADIEPWFERVAAQVQEVRQCLGS